MRYGGDGPARAIALWSKNRDLTEGEYPPHHAKTQNNLAVALYNHGTAPAGRRGAALLAGAVTTYRAALEVRTRAAHPVDWAMTQWNIAILYGNWAALEPDRAAVHLRDALGAVDVALEVFDPEHMRFNHDNATESRSDVLAALEDLSE